MVKILFLRRVGRTFWLNRPVRILSIFLWVLGVILLLWVAMDHTPLVVQVAGKSVEGHVIGKMVDYHGAEEEAETGVLKLRYEFDVDGVKHSGDATVPRPVYDAAEPGKSVTVFYLQARPSFNFPQGYLGQGVRGLPLLIVGLVCFIAGVILM